MRFLMAGMLAAVITLGLFWGMSALIRMDSDRLQQAAQHETVNFIRVKQESRTETKQRVKPKVEQAEPPPAAPMPVMQTATPSAPVPDALSFDVPALDLGLQLNTAPSLGDAIMAPATVAHEAPLVPLVRVPPQYPRRAAMRRIEGWVKVAFTIDTSGHVKPGSVRVIAAEPARVFEQAAIRAIYQWRFKPHTVDGQPQSRQAVQTLEFRL